MTNNPIVKRNKIADFRLAETFYPPGLKQTRHRHEMASLSFVVAGSYTENYGHQTRTCHSSTLVLHPAQEFHSVDFHNQPVQILNVRADFVLLSGFSKYSKVLDSALSFRSADIAWLGNRLYREFSQPDEFSALAIEGIVLEMLVEASRQSSNKAEQKSSRWLSEAKDFLHDNFSESVGLEEVAKTVGVHPVHLARAFRRQFGCTIGEYVRLLRVEFAKRQISTTKHSLCEIALAVGFADQSHFTRIFKSQLGLTPSEYRKKVR